MRNVKEKVKWRTAGQVLMCKREQRWGCLLLKQIHLKIRLKYWSSKLWVLNSCYSRLACEGRDWEKSCTYTQNKTMGLRERREGWFCLEKKISILEETEYIYIHRDTHREREREEGRVGEREVTLNNRVWTQNACSHSQALTMRKYQQRRSHGDAIYG